MILSEEGLYLKLCCPVCAGEYLFPKSRWAWAQKKGLGLGQTCSRSCARKKWHAEHPGAGYFNNMPAEQRGRSTGTRRSDEYRAAMSAKLKALGHKPMARGGNGAGMTPAEACVREALGTDWVWNYPVALGPRRPGYPTNYKLDFANLKLKIGLEVDGGTHNSRQGKERDAKKTRALSALGWKVFRVSNATVMSASTTSKLKALLTTLLRGS